MTAVKDLAYYKANAEEDYLAVPISVLRYISQLEQEQEKNKYSEEDLKQAYLDGCDLKLSNPYHVKEWFKQFKKK